MFRVIPTGLQHGTVTVVVHGDAEVTTLRSEGRTATAPPRRVEFVDDIADLARRDFTFNAIAIGLSTATSSTRSTAAGISPPASSAPWATPTSAGEDDLRVPSRRSFRRHPRGARIDPPPRLRWPRPLARHLPQGQRRAHPRRVDEDDARPSPQRRLRGDAPHEHPLHRLPRAHRVHRLRAEPLARLRCGATPWPASTPASPSPSSASPPSCTTWASLAAAPSRKNQRLHVLRARAHRRRDGRPILARLHFSNDERAKIVGLIRHHLICYSDDWTDAAVRRWLRRVTPELAPDLYEIGFADARGKGRDASTDIVAIEQLKARVEALLAAGAPPSPRRISPSTAAPS
ncbi:MAG: hypothetical protein R3B70_30360 [Polyangiaceae bacterium]